MRRPFKIYLENQELGGVVLLALLVVLFEFASGGTFENMRGVLGLMPRWGLVAIGVTILMIAGEFDLSVRAVFVLAPMVMAVSMVAAVPFVPAVLLGLLAAAVFGFLNGFITLRFGIPSFITTLGMLFVARSVTVLRRSPEFLFESLFAIKKSRIRKNKTLEMGAILLTIIRACSRFSHLLASSSWGG